MKKNLKNILTAFIIFSFNFTSYSIDSLTIESRIESLKNSIRSNNDSVSIMLEQFKEDATKTNNLYGLSQYHFLNGFFLNKQSEFLLAIDEYNNFLKLENDSTSKGSIDQLNRIAICYKNLSDFEKARFYYEKAVELGIRSNYHKGVGDSYSGIGQIFERSGKYDKGMEYYTKSTEAFKRIGDSIGLSVSYNNIGNIMYYQGNFEQALKYYKKAAYVDFLIKNELHMASTYGNIGMIYSQMEELDSSLVYNLKALKYFEKTQNPFYLGTMYNNIALVYYDLEEYNTSLSYHLKSKSIKEEIGDKSGLATSFINIGNILVKLNNYQQAIDNYKEGLSICEDFESLVLKRDGHKGLSKAYQEMGKYEKALNSYIVYSALNDSLTLKETKNNTARLEAEFDNKLKEETIAQQKADYENDIAIEKAKSETRTILLLSVSLFLVVVTLFLIIFYRKLNQTRKQKAIIEKVNTENKILLGEIHHRVKNNLQVISSLLSLQEKNISDVTAKTAISEGKERVKSMGLIHKMLYQNDNFSGIVMSEYIEKLLDGLMESFGINESLIETEKKLDELKLDVETAIPIGLIINELIINVFKYALENIESPKLLIKFEKQTQGLFLQVKDNGNGNPEEVEKSNSFGIKLVKSLIRQINGELTIDYEDGLNYSILIKDYKIV